MFRSMNKMYYRNVHGVVLVCDIFNIESFKCLESWLTEFLLKQDRSGDPQDFAFMLLANKIDLIKDQ
jgi:GTPase SAR1 family protein